MNNFFYISLRMIRELRDSEISLYINEYLFIYDLYNTNNKNYETTLKEILVIINDNKISENFHNILLEIIDIDNIKNNIINKNKIKISLDNYLYSKKIISIFKETISKSITYNILNDLLKNSLIIIIKCGKTNKHLIKFDEVHLNSKDLMRISEYDYTNDICQICLENINSFKSFRIFNCCFSKTCSICYKQNNYKCPICNEQTKTLISY